MVKSSDVHPRGNVAPASLKPTWQLSHNDLQQLSLPGFITLLTAGPADPPPHIPYTPLHPSEEESLCLSWLIPPLLGMRFVCLH